MLENKFSRVNITRENDFYILNFCYKLLQLILATKLMGIKLSMDTLSAKKEKIKKTGPQTLLAYGVQAYEPAADEEYMNANQLSHFKNILNIWKKDLLEEGDNTIQDLQDAEKNSADISDQATAWEIFSVKLKTRDRAAKLIKKIEESIDMINRDEYGFCESCGIEIGLRRLEARPTATLCIDCKTLAEIKEKQKG